jgi:kinesin family member 15
MSDFKDNVKVAIRIRPFNDKELSENPSKCLTILESKSIILDSKPEPRTFTYDNVANEKSTQEQIFEIVGMPITTSCIRGYNGTIFAYGQTGAGKTFTIQGAGYDEFSSNTKQSYHLRGILPRCFEYLFANIGKEVSDKKSQYLVKCSYLEIYQENINDLLDPAPRNLQLREDMKKGVYVEGLIEETVKSAMETYELLNIGTQNRHVSFTSMNKESSRSHSVFTLIIESKNTIDGLVNFKTSRFHLIDLAGSERQKATDCAGERLKEAGMINKSLSALGNVINSLVDISEGKSRHVHYRDSKLTFLLKDSLGGNSKTFIIANVSPAVSSFSETLSTLKFAQRAKMIKNAAVVNEDVTGTVNLLKYEIKKLKDELLIQKSLAGEASTFCSRCSSTLSKNFELLNLLEIVKDLEFLLEKNSKLRVSAEKQLQIEINEKNEETKALKVALSKVESKANHDKMVLKFRDATIAKLQVGVESADIENLKKENISLKEQVENNPLAAQLFVENRKLKAENEQLKKECKVDSESWNGRIREGHDYTEQLSETLRLLAEEKTKIIEWVKKLDSDNESLKIMLEKMKKQYEEKVKILESENNGLVSKVRSLMNSKSQRDYFGDEENLLKSAEIIQDFFTDSENSSLIQNYQKEIEHLKIKLAEKEECSHKGTEDIEEKFRKVQEELDFYIENTENKDNQLKQSLQEIENLTEACEFLKSNNEALSKNLVEKEEDQVELTQTIKRLENQLTELINSVDGSQEIISNCENLTKKVEELEKDRKNLEKIQKSLTKENKRLETLYENTLNQENAEKKNVSMLYEKLSATLNELQEFKESHQELTEKLEILEEEKGKLTENCAGLDELNDRIRGLQVEKEGFLEKLREDERLKENLEELREKLNERNGSFEELYGKLEELMAEKMVVVGKINEAMRVEEGLRDQNEKFAAQIEQLEGNLRKEKESLGIEIENLRNQLEEIVENKNFEVNSGKIKIKELENALIMYENSQNSQEEIIKNLENRVKALKSELKSKKKQVSGLSVQHNSELSLSNEKFLELGNKLETLQETHNRVFEKLNREKKKRQEFSQKAENYLNELKNSEATLKTIKDNQVVLEKTLEATQIELEKVQKQRNEVEKTFGELKNEKKDLQVLVINNSEVIQSLHTKILESQEALKAEIDLKNEKNLFLTEKIKEIKVLEEKISNLTEEKENIYSEKELVLAENERLSKLSQQNEESVKDLQKCLEDERACIEENIVLRLNTEEKLQDLEKKQ